MPNRILRDWTDSERVNQLSWQAESVFVRLIMKVDDYGRFTANSRLLKALLFPLKDGLRDTDISRWIAECEKAGLIRVYTASDKDGRPKQFLEIGRFGQRSRAEKSKYPEPPADYSQSIQSQDCRHVESGTDDSRLTDNCQSDDGQMTVNCQTDDCQPRTEAETYSKAEANKHTRSPRFAEFAENLYSAYPRKVGKASAIKAISNALKRNELTYEQMLEKVNAFAASPAGNAGNYTPHPATWFNAARYLDDPAEWKRKQERNNGQLELLQADPSLDSVTSFEETPDITSFDPTQT